VIVVALTGALALFAAPTTWDSMTYHLARVADWAQDHTVSARPLVEFTVPAEAPPGTYRFFARLVRQRQPRGKSISPEDILASDVRDVVLAR
jgi:hypothetical protein